MKNYDISMGSGVIQMSGGGSFAADNSINYDWISRTSPADYKWYGIVYGNGLFVAVAADGSNYSVMTSPDGITWTLCTTPIPGITWRSITYGNGYFVVIADGGSGVRSMNSPDGITWTARQTVNDTNAWLTVTYGTPGGTPTFVAVAYNGTNRIMYSTNNGNSWTGITTYDSIEWFGVTFGNGRFVVTPTQNGRYAMYSTNGTTWTQSNTVHSLRWGSITYGNGLFVAVSDGPFYNVTTIGTGGQQLNSHVMTSPDGITWTNRYSSDTGWSGITYGAGLFVAVAYSSTGNRVMTSSDGINWTQRPSANDSLSWYGITYGNGIFVATAVTGSGNRVMTLNPAGGLTLNRITTEETTTNLVKFGQNGATLSAYPSKNYTWVARTPSATANWYGVCYGNGQFVAVAYGGTGTNQVMTSPDGYIWTTRQSSAANNWNSVCYGELSGNNMYVAVSTTGSNKVMTSTDGVTWLPRSSANESAVWCGVCFGYDTNGNGMFVAVADAGTGNRVMTSPNGINWTLRNVDTTFNWRGVCYGYDSNGIGQFVATGYGGSGNRCMTSTDGGVTWVGRPTIDNNSGWEWVCYGNGTFVAVANSGTAGNRVMYSKNIIGAGWSKANCPVENGWWSVCFGNGLFVATATSAGSGAANQVMTSPDGINWTIRTAANDNDWRNVCYGNGTFVAVSNNTAGNQVMTNDYTAYDNTVVTTGKVWMNDNVHIGPDTFNRNYKLTVCGGQQQNTIGQQLNFRIIRTAIPAVQNETSFGIATGIATVNIASPGKASLMVSGGAYQSNLWGNIPDIDVMSLNGSGQVFIGSTNTSAYTGTISTSKDVSIYPTGLFLQSNTTISSAVYMGMYTIGGGGSAGFELRRGGGFDTSIYTYTNSGAQQNANFISTQGPYIAAGGTTWITGSDINLKTNIVELSNNTLDTVCNIKAVKFNWKIEPESKKKCIGFIAQNVNEYYPEVVTTDYNGYLGVEYSSIVPILLKAIQELNSKVNSQQTSIQSLEQRLALLEQRQS